MSRIPDFTATECWIVRTTLRERYGHDQPFQLADAEVRLRPSDRALTDCPIVHWQTDDGCQFVVLKTGEDRYRCQFFHEPYRQFGTGVPEYDHLAECLVALLQAQADHAAERRGDLPARRAP